ncbi:MAG: hypothetical protein J6W64_05825 [Bacilli bacterium]|nr:hypothetical protein [Bacilli bacterium]
MTNDTSNIGTGLTFETNNEYDEVMHRFKNELASIGTNSLNGEIRGMF